MNDLQDCSGMFISPVRECKKQVKDLFTIPEQLELIRKCEHPGKRKKIRRFYYKITARLDRSTVSFVWYDVEIYSRLTEKTYILTVGKPRYPSLKLQSVLFGEVPHPGKGDYQL